METDNNANDNTMTTPNAQPRNKANTNSNNSNCAIQMNNRNVNQNDGSNFIQQAPERMDDDVVNGINQMNTLRPTRNRGQHNESDQQYLQYMMDRNNKQAEKDAKQNHRDNTYRQFSKSFSSRMYTRYLVKDDLIPQRIPYHTLFK
jgi:DNA-binding helix-hairpin-helix protein with protein kinase domain